MYPRVLANTRAKYSEKVGLYIVPCRYYLLICGWFQALTNHKLASFDVNHPCSLLVIYETVALLMRRKPSEVAKQTTANAFRVYGLD